MATSARKHWRKAAEMATDADASNLVRVCSVEGLPPGEVMLVPVSPPIALYNVDGEFYATDDLCTHGQSSLSDEGYVEGGEIECGWHFARFCIKTGAVKAPPASKPLSCYEVRVIDGEVYVAVG
jgi:3-phenylpropionate/trans-cinnamate dioxygenase ferredoxin component